MVGSSVYGSKNAAVLAPMEPSEKNFRPPIRNQSSPCPVLSVQTARPAAS